MARRLTIIGAAVLALGLSGCDEEFCAASVDDPIAAILVGLLCAGVDPPPENPPRAVFVMEPTTVDHGGVVRFDASGSRDNGRIVKYEWDLNGISLDGADLRGFEVDAGEEAVIERQVTAFFPGAEERRSIRLRVTDNGGHTHEIAHVLTIRGTELVADFTVTPNPVFVGMTATFDATASKGALFYSWDLDGDGTFETGPSTSPGENHGYPTAGQQTVRLRITDALGRSSEAQRVVNVIASRAVASAAAKRRGFTAQLTRVRLPDTLPAPVVRGGVTTLRGLAVRGRLVAPARRLGPLRPFRRARWIARLNVRATADGSRLRGVAIARFPHGRGTACLRITMATRDRGRPAGRVTVLGGSGDAARLRGGGRFRFAFRDGAPRLAGRLRASLGRPRPLPPTCPRRTP
jgi:hypothetical protein